MIKAVWTDRALSVQFPFDLCVFLLSCGRLFDLFRYRVLDWLIRVRLRSALTGEGSEKERRTVKMRPYSMSGFLLMHSSRPIASSSLLSVSSLKPAPSSIRFMEISCTPECLDSWYLVQPRASRHALISLATQAFISLDISALSPFISYKIISLSISSRRMACWSWWTYLILSSIDSLLSSSYANSLLSCSE